MRQIGTSQEYCLIYTGDENVESYVWVYAFEENGVFHEIGIPVINAKEVYSEEEREWFCLNTPAKAV